MALAAYLNAGRAVNAGISRAEYQTHRLLIYLKNRPQVEYPIPEMRIGEDEQLIVGWPKDRRHPIERALDDGESIEEIDALAGGARREHDRATEEHAKTTARVAELDAQSTDLQREDTAANAIVTAAVSAGAVPPDPRGTHRRMPSLPVIIFLRTFQVLLMLGESFLTFRSLAGLSGIDISNLLWEWRVNPWGVAGYALASAACASLLFVITDKIFVAIRRAIERTEYDPRRNVKMAATVAGAVLVVGVCAFLTETRQNLGASADAVSEAFRSSAPPHRQAGPWVGYFLLALLPLVGAACVDEAVKELLRQRAEILDERAKPTSEELATARRRALRRELEIELERVQAYAAQLAATITLCLAQIRAAEDRRRELAAHEEQVVTQFVDDVAACLSKDHYFFTSLARKRGCANLLSSPGAAAGAQQAPGTVVQISRKRRARTSAAGTVVSILLAISLIRCAKAPEAPATTALIVPNAATVRTHEGEALAAYDTWLRASIRSPGAQFALYVTSPGPGGAACPFRTAIPASWGKGDVQATKAAFIRETRASLASVLTQGCAGSDVPDGFPVTPQQTAMVLPAVDSRGRAWVWAPAPQPVNDINICDTSSSGRNHSCTPATLLSAFDDWLAAGATRADSSFTVLLVGNSLSATKSLFVAVAPARAPIDQVTWLLAAREDLTRKVSALPVSGSAVSEALFLGISLVRERRGLRRVHILSDLREISDDGAINFEARVPTPEAFNAWMQERGLSVPAADIAISVCGVHHEVSPGMASLTAEEMTATRDAWIRALTSMHPSSLRICADCATADIDPVDVLPTTRNVRGH